MCSIWVCVYFWVFIILFIVLIMVKERVIFLSCFWYMGLVGEVCGVVEVFGVVEMWGFLFRNVGGVVVVEGSLYWGDFKLL